MSDCYHVVDDDWTFDYGFHLQYRRLRMIDDAHGLYRSEGACVVDCECSALHVLLRQLMFLPRFASSLTCIAIPLMERSSAFLMTGTYSLSSPATAMEMLMSLLTTILSPRHELLSIGYSLSVSATAFTKKLKKVRL